MNNPLKILQNLDKNLSHPVSLLIYGKAAIALGFPVPPNDAGITMDVDAAFQQAQPSVMEIARKLAGMD